jgi:hypothetical protein
MPKFTPAQIHKVLLAVAATLALVGTSDQFGLSDSVKHVCMLAAFIIGTFFFELGKIGKPTASGLKVTFTQSGDTKNG